MRARSPELILVGILLVLAIVVLSGCSVIRERVLGGEPPVLASGKALERLADEFKLHDAMMKQLRGAAAITESEYAEWAEFGHVFTQRWIKAYTAWKIIGDTDDVRAAVRRLGDELLIWAIKTTREP